MKKFIYYLIFILVVILLDILLFPSILNVFASVVPMTATVPQPNMAFLNWEWALSNGEIRSFTIAGQGLLLIVIILYFSNFSGSKKSGGDEYGSARFLTEAEFIKGMKRQFIKKDSFNIIRESEHIDLITEETSNTDIFKSLDLVEEGESDD